MLHLKPHESCFPISPVGVNRHSSQLHLSTRLCSKSLCWFFVWSWIVICTHYQHSVEDLQRDGGWGGCSLHVCGVFCAALSSPLNSVAFIPLDPAQSTQNAFQPCLCSPFLHLSYSLETPKAVSFANPKTDLIFPITVLCCLLSSA